MYRVQLPSGEEISVSNLDELRKLGAQAKIWQSSYVYDEKSGRTFQAGEHPFLRNHVAPDPRPQPPQAVMPTPPVMADAPTPQSEASIPLARQFEGPLTLPQGVTEYAYKEYVSQWSTLDWWVAMAVLGIWTGPIAIGMFVYSLIRKQALRQRVAEAGIDPRRLEYDGDARFWASAKPIVNIVGWIVVAIFFAVFVDAVCKRIR